MKVMKKILLSVCALFLIMGKASAEDTFTVDDIRLPQNGEADVTIRFSLDEGSTCSGYTFWLQVPEQLEFVTYVRNEKTYITYTAGDCYNETPTITPNLDGGYLKVGCLTANSDPISGQTGVLVTFKLKTVGNVAAGDQLVCKLTEGTISAENGSVHNVADATFTVTIGEPDDGRLKFYETSTTLPSYTAGEKADVTMHRTIKAGQWSTIVLPFTLTKAKAEAAFGSDVELYEFTGYTTTVDVENDLTPTAIQINFSKYVLKNALSSITGGKPYLIRTSKDIETIEADDVKLVDAVAPVSKTDTEYDILEGKFNGSLVKTKVPENGLFISENKFWYSTGATHIKAFRAWFELDAVLNQEIALSRIVLNFEDETTGITVAKNGSASTETTYDLQGRRIAKTNKKGVYIRDGKKIVVK